MRPVVVGMNNPLSADPRSALLPAPRGSAGWNLWKMCHDVCGVSRWEFRQSMEFVNLCDARLWCPLAARAKYERVSSGWEGRRVLLLGRAVLGVLRLPAPASGLLWASHAGFRWCYAPHPSGLNRDYNDPLTRLAVGLRLEELCKTSTGST